MTSAIVDVGHIVTTHALAAGDHDLALWAAQVAYTAAPYDEVAQLDMIQAEKASGDDDKAAPGPQRQGLQPPRRRTAADRPSRRAPLRSSATRTGALAGHARGELVESWLTT